MVNHVFADEYTGPGYHYYSPLRPIVPTLLPEGFTVVIRVGQNPRIVVTTTPLPETFVKQWSLESRDTDGAVTP